MQTTVSVTYLSSAFEGTSGRFWVSTLMCWITDFFIFLHLFQLEMFVRYICHHRERHKVLQLTNYARHVTIGFFQQQSWVRKSYEKQKWESKYRTKNTILFDNAV